VEERGEIIIVQIKKWKAIWKNRRQDTKRIMKMEKGMIFLAAFGGLCISSNIKGRQF
jgi:hypothetical protein